MVELTNWWMHFKLIPQIIPDFSFTATFSIMSWWSGAKVPFLSNIHYRSSRYCITKGSNMGSTNPALSTFLKYIFDCLTYSLTYSTYFELYFEVQHLIPLRLRLISFSIYSKFPCIENKEHLVDFFIKGYKDRNNGIILN